MRDRIRKTLVVVIFFTAVAGVWTLGAVKADLDGPSGLNLQVDPELVRAALLADPGIERETVEAEASMPRHLLAS